MNAIPTSSPAPVTQNVRGWDIENRLQAPPETLGIVSLILDHATRATEKASPLHSHFPTGAAALLSDNSIPTGSNSEYGHGTRRAHTRAMHCEEALVAVAQDTYQLGRQVGKDNIQIEISATVAGHGIPAPSCGNCRDVLRTYSSPNAIHVAGSLDKKAILFSPKDYLPNDFPKVELSKLSEAERMAVIAAKHAFGDNFAYLADADPGPAGAAIVTDDGATFEGVRIDTAAYHPILPLSAALAHAYNHRDPFVSAVAFASRDGYLWGSERQVLFELAQAMGRESTLPVLLVNTETNKIHRTTPAELLPFAFGIRDIGQSEQLEKRLSHIHAQRRPVTFGQLHTPELLLPDTATDDLLTKVAQIFRGDADLRADMYRVRRWHAYYRSPLDRDTNGFGHMLNTVDIARALSEPDVAAGILTESDAKDLCITGYIHDLGEIELGNATYGGKSQEHEKKEFAQFESVLASHFTGLSGEEQEKLRTLFREVAFGDKKTVPLARYFNMIEVTGYTTFGMQMFEARPDNFQWEILAWRILAYHLFRQDSQSGAPVDVPEHLTWSAGARAYWQRHARSLDSMVEHFSEIDQSRWIREVYQQLPLPDRMKVKPIDFSRWTAIRAAINP